MRCVYVIQLALKAGTRNDPRLPWLYVGQTGLTPEERFANHKAGQKSSYLPREYGLFLRPDLYDDLAPVTTDLEALDLERRRAEELVRCGFVVKTDGVELSAQPPYEQWGRDRVEPILDSHLDPAIFRVVATVVRPVNPESCAHLLYGTQSQEVRTHIGDPILEYGRFAHVAYEVLLTRVNELVSGGVLTQGRQGDLEFARTIADEPLYPEAGSV